MSINADFPAKLQCLFQPSRYKVLYGGRGAGRCLGKGTRVLMFDGTDRCVEDVSVGEYLMGPDSLPRQVLSVTKGVGKLYKIKQAGNGISYVVNTNHILSLKKSHSTGLRRRDGKIYQQNRYPDEPDVVNISVEDWRKKSAKWKTFFFGYKAEAIDFQALPGKLTIDPYFLGMWLGDGTSRELRLTVCHGDWEIIKYCEDYVAKFGNTVSICEKIGVGAYDVGFPTLTGRVNEVWQKFVKANLVNNKHIPEEYQVASQSERLALLAGLIDSDGYCHNNGYEFTNTNIDIMYGAKRLADFLGFKTGLRAKEPNGKDRKQKAYTLSINGDVWKIPCKLPRKILKEENIVKNKDFRLRAITVSSAGNGEYFGFELDKDHLFMLSDGTVTHNSWGMARALLLQGTQQPLRILCAREFQNSISDSVHKLLSDQILALGLGDFYNVLQSRIEGKNGSYFAFEGIKNNVGRIKSYEAIDRCWVEEADKTSRNSWGVLIPTIRKPDSEIWMSFNPSLDTDYTYRRFVLEADESMLVQKMTWADNPWFPDVLRDEMLRDKERDYDYYLNVWEGHCVQQLEGAIYAKELRKATERGQICRVAWDKNTPVDTWWDLGRADRTAIWFGQRVAMESRLIDYYENFGEDITHYLKFLQKKEYVYGTVWLPHDAKAKKLGSKHSIEEVARGYGFNVRIVPRLSVVDGINAGRMALQSTYFDEKNCQDGLNRLRHYRYRVVDGHLSNEPLHDDASDGADAFRYYAVASKTPGVGSAGIKQRLADAAAALRGDYDKAEEFSGRGRSGASTGWMG